MTLLRCRCCWSTSCFLIAMFLTANVDAQLNVIYQEGFNDDGVGSRYEMVGRGQLIGSDGPGAWEHSFLVDAIGLPSSAAAKRAAILWSDAIAEEDFTEASLQVWDNLIDYMIDGKENATIGFLGDISAPTPDFLSFRVEDAGHNILELTSDLPDAGEIDLVIHTQSGTPATPTAFIDYAVPLITYNAQNHDDTAISSIGATTSAGPTTVNIAESDHPVLEGVTAGPMVQWIDDFIADEPLQGIGGAYPPGATALATYVDPDTELVLPAVLLVEAGDDLLGAFAPIPEGTGYIIGGDLNLDFEQGEGAASAEVPVSLTLNPVDVSDASDVQLSIDLAATTVDFEPVDFVRVSYAPDPSSEFVVLGDFQGLDDANSPNNKSLVDPNLGALSADEFTTFTFDIPDTATELVVKVEAFSTFPNEVLGIDNIVVFTGEAVANPFDCSGDGELSIEDVSCATSETIEGMIAELGYSQGDLDFSGDVAFPDFLTLSGNFGDAAAAGVYTNGDINLDGEINFPDFLTLSGNFGQPAAAAASTPEPSAGFLLLGAMTLSGSLLRRRRT